MSNEFENKLEQGKKREILLILILIIMLILLLTDIINSITFCLIGIVGLFYNLKNGNKRKISLIILLILFLNPLVPNFILSAISTYNLNKGNFKTAEKLELKLVNFYHFLGEKNSYYLKSLQDLSDFYFYHGYYAKALDSLQKNYEIRKKYNLFESNEGKFLLIRLYYLKNLEGDYPSSKYFLNKAINIKNNSLSETIENKFELLDLELQYKNIENAKKIIKELNLENNIDYWLKKYGDFYVTILSRYYQIINEKNKTEALYKKYLSISNENNFRYCYILNELANFYLKNKEYKKAKNIFSKLLPLAEKNNKDLIFLTDVYTDYGIFKLIENDYSNAFTYIQKAMLIRNKILNKNTPKVICSKYFYQMAFDKNNFIDIYKIKSYRPINNNRFFIDKNNLTEYCTFIELENKL